MKLEIGSQGKKDGWITLDINPSCNTDIIADAFQKLPIADNSVDELFASHVIEHASWYYTQDILKDWVRVIKPSGFIHIICPDFKHHVKFYLDHPETLYEHEQIAVGIYGHQHMHISMIHRAGLDRYYLEKYLDNAGITNMHWNQSNLFELNVIGQKK